MPERPELGAFRPLKLILFYLELIPSLRAQYTVDELAWINP